MTRLATKLRIRSAAATLAVVASFALMLTTPASTFAPGDRIAGQSVTLLSDGTWLRLGGTTAEGMSSAALLIDQQGVERPLNWHLSEPRTGHTATVLPDGHVLVIGGLGSDGRPNRSYEVLDPIVGPIEHAAAPEGLERVHHTATLLTNGSVLLVGGQRTDGSLADSGIWDHDLKMFDAWHVSNRLRRSNHLAVLDDGVLINGGRDGRGEPADALQRYDVVRNSVFESADVPARPNSTLVAETLPVNGAREVPISTRLAVRFSNPIAVGSVQGAAITLSSPLAPVNIQAVAAESGRLLFLSPAAPLEPQTTYHFSVSGLRDLGDSAVPSVTVVFTTVAEDPTNVPDDADEGSGGTDSSWRRLPPLRAPAGETALAGQVLRLNGQPLPDVTLEIDDTSTRSDRTGRFLLTGLEPGHHELVIDGRSASRPGRTYGIFEAGIEALAGRTSVLPYTIWMTKLDTAHAVQIPSPTTSELVVTTPRLPGLELRIPPGTTILDEDHHVVTEISITPVPIDQPPFPLPAGVHVPIYFTIQPGGAYLRNPSRLKARLIYPNTYNKPVGTVFDFWNYDADGAGWYIYGQGVVGSDGRSVIPNPGVGIYVFTGAMVGDPNVGPPEPSPPVPADPDTQGPGGGPSPSPDPTTPKPPTPPKPHDGDPVDLATGLFVYQRTDVSLADSWPVKLERVYRPGDSAQRPFGVGSTHNYELLLLGNSTNWSEMWVILPSGGRIHYVRTSPGSSYAAAVLEAEETPSTYAKSVITWNGNGWNLTLKNETVYVFPEAFGQTTAAKNALVGVRDRFGNKQILVRATNGNLTKITSPNGRWLDFVYDTSNRITSITDNAGRTTTYAYDTSGRLTTVTDPDSKTIQYTYDSSNRMLTIQDRRGIVFLSNTYDTAGRVSSQTLQNSSTYQFAYTVNGSNQVTQTDVTDPAGFVRRVAFNATGYITSDTQAFGEPEAQTTTYIRNTDNQITSVTDALGRETTYGYDAAGNRTSITNLAGTANAVTTTFTYESTFNLMTSVTDPLDHTTTFAYNTLGELASVSDPLSHQWTFGNSATGLLLTATDPMSHLTTLSYDGGSLTGVTDALGNSRTQFVNSVGLPTVSIDPLGRTTQLTYDAIGRVTSTSDPLGGVTNFDFDENGNVLAVTDPQTHAIAYAYDQMDRPQTRTDPLLNQEAFAFDVNGRLEQYTDRNSQVTTYSYDALNRRTGVTFDDASTIDYTYDAGNRLTQIDDSIYGTITRTYDDLDRLTDETTPQGEVSYTYDAAGRRTSMTVAGQTEITYAYDDANRLTSITRGTTVVSFTYDAANRRTSTTYPNGVVATYGYDAANHLTSITFANGGGSLGDLTYTYDAAGNRTSVTGSPAGTVLPTAVGSATYNAANRLTQWGATTLTYDSAGNMTGDGTNAYTWNARNQLAGISGGATASFAYDPLGRRSTRTVNSTETRYLYDGLNSVQELDGAAPTANLITGLGMDETFVRSDGSGTLSLLADALGSILALTDGSGAIATQYAYGAFGQVSVTGTASANGSEFTGRDNDGTGLYAYRARYYSPILGRFISDDPIGVLGGINATSYVGNNPLAFVDPLGLYESRPNPCGLDRACLLAQAIGNTTASVGNGTALGAFVAAGAGTGAAVAAVTTGAAATAATAVYVTAANAVTALTTVVLTHPQETMQFIQGFIPTGSPAPGPVGPYSVPGLAGWLLRKMVGL